MASLRPITDGVVTIRPPAAGDRERLIAGRDAAFRRFLGYGSDDPRPTGCIVVGDDVIGWVDVDADRDWLEPGQVNLGYSVFADHRGRGYGTRAVKLVLHHLAQTRAATVATVLIRSDNVASRALAARAGFVRRADIDDNTFWTQPVPPLVYCDGLVTIRRRQHEDLDMDLEAKDEEQIRWMWLPGQRQAWEQMSPSQQRTHTTRVLRDQHETFGAGPKWTFTVDAGDARSVAYVDCDLANDQVAPGEANVSYSCHPAHRGKGYVGRAVALVVRFLQEHTGARYADIITDEENTASRRVALAASASPVERWTSDRGTTMLRHRMPLRDHHLP